MLGLLLNLNLHATIVLAGVDCHTLDFEWILVGVLFAIRVSYCVDESEGLIVDLLMLGLSGSIVLALI